MPGKTIRFINLSDGIDPDDFIKQNGVNGFKKLIENSIPLNKQIWNNTFIDSDTSNPEGRANLESQLRSILKKNK